MPVLCAGCLTNQRLSGRLAAGAGAESAAAVIDGSGPVSAVVVNAITISKLKELPIYDAGGKALRGALAAR